MQTDSDSMVNIDLLVTDIENFKSGFTGMTAHKDIVNRNSLSTSYMPKEIYPNYYWPDFVYGSGYVMTKDVKKLLLQALEQYKGFILDIEDAFITGVIAEAAIPRHYNQNCNTFDLIVEDMSLMCLTFLCVNALQLKIKDSSGKSGKIP